MKSFKARFLATCGLVALIAASLASVAADAGCPKITVDCGGGKVATCSGTQEGTKCVYEEACLNKCEKGDDEMAPSDGPDT